MKSAIAKSLLLSMPHIAVRIAHKQREESRSNVKAFFDEIASNCLVGQQIANKHTNLNLNICTLSTAQSVIPNICSTSFSHVTTAATINITNHSTRHINIRDVKNSHYAYYELKHSDCSDVKIIDSDTVGYESELASARDLVIDKIINQPEFASFLKGHSVDVLLIESDCKTLDLELLPCAVLRVSKATDTGVVSFLSSVANPQNRLQITSYRQMHNDIKRLGCTGSVSNVIVFDGKGHQLAYLGDCSCESKVVPYYIDSCSDAAKEIEPVLRHFLPTHWQVAKSESIDESLELSSFCSRREIESGIYKAIREVESVYLADL